MIVFGELWLWQLTMVKPELHSDNFTPLDTYFCSSHSSEIFVKVKRFVSKDWGVLLLNKIVLQVRENCKV